MNWSESELMGVSVVGNGESSSEVATEVFNLFNVCQKTGINSFLGSF